MPFAKRQAVVAALWNADNYERTLSELYLATTHLRGALWRVLARLEADQIITSDWSDNTEGPRNRIYRLTDFAMAAVIANDTRSRWARLISRLIPGKKP